MRQLRQQQRRWLQLRQQLVGRQWRRFSLQMEAKLLWGQLVGSRRRWWQQLLQHMEAELLRAQLVGSRGRWWQQLRQRMEAKLLRWQLRQQLEAKLLRWQLVGAVGAAAQAAAGGAVVEAKLLRWQLGEAAQAAAGGKAVEAAQAAAGRGPGAGPKWSARARPSSSRRLPHGGHHFEALAAF